MFKARLCVPVIDYSLTEYDLDIELKKHYLFLNKENGIFLLEDDIEVRTYYCGSDTTDLYIRIVFESFSEEKLSEELMETSINTVIKNTCDEPRIEWLNRTSSDIPKNLNDVDEDGWEY